MKRLIMPLAILALLAPLCILSLRAADQPPDAAPQSNLSAAWTLQNRDFVDAASIGVSGDSPRLADLAIESLDPKDRGRIIRLLDKKDLELSFSLDNSTLAATLSAKSPKGQENLNDSAPLVFTAVDKALRKACAAAYEDILKRLQTQKDAAQKTLDQLRNDLVRKKSQLALIYNIAETPPVVDRLLDELRKQEIALQVKAVAVETEIRIIRGRLGLPEPPDDGPPAFDPATATPEQIKARIAEINAQIKKANSDIKKYNQQIAELQKQIDQLAATSGEDDPAVKELGNALAEVQNAANETADQSRKLEREKWELENADAALPAPQTDEERAAQSAQYLNRLAELQLQQTVINSQQELLRKEIDIRLERLKSLAALLAEIENLKNKEYYLEKDFDRAADRYDAVSFEYDLKKDTAIRRAH
jgi:DNA repair exonuclease SbcCD ATPase subunit